MNPADLVTEVRPPRRWRRRLFLGGLLLIAFGLFAPFLYVSITSQSKLQKAIAEADELDPGWRIYELEAKRAVIPDEQNSGLLLISAINLIPNQWPYWESGRGLEGTDLSPEELKALSDSFYNLDSPAQLDAQQIAALRSELKRATAALERARKVVEMPTGRLPITYTKDYISTSFAHTQVIRRIATLLGYDVLLRAQEKDFEGALLSCRGILNASRSIGDEPWLMSTLVRIALDHIAVGKIERTLAQGEATECSLVVLQRVLEKEGAEPLLLIGARGDRGFTDGLMEAIQNGEVPVSRLAFGSKGTNFFLESLHFFLPGSVKTSRAALLKLNTRFVEIAKLPVEQQRGPLAELDAAGKKLPLLARLLGSAHGKVAEAFRRHQAILRCGIALVAVERYRRAKGRWPEKLSDLAPDYLPQVPTDPYDGAPLRLVRFIEGVTIYSVGPDGVDDGGNLDRKAPRAPGTDLGLRLWNPEKRRQAPKPWKDKETGSP